MDKFLIFVGGFGIAMYLMIYRAAVINFFGKSQWAEDKLGPGGSYTLVIIVAFVIWLGTMAYALGSLDLLFGFFAKIF